MTLIYFNVKYFMLKTLEEHKKLSFTHIMKHYKKGGTATPVTRNTTPVHPGEKQTLLLRYYPPADRKNFIIYKNISNRSSRRKRGMASHPLFIKACRLFFLHFPNELCYGYLSKIKLRQLTWQTFFPTFPQEFFHFLQT